MTCGNGNDTLFLAKHSKKVFGFDIQDVAIDNTKKLLKENNVNNYELFNTSHDKIDNVLKDYKSKISLILFNLGYLPGGDKNITTNHKITLNALRKSFNILNNKGIILIVVYPHTEGKKEEKVIKDYLINNNIKFEEYHNTNNINAPYLIKCYR